MFGCSNVAWQPPVGREKHTESALHAALCVSIFAHLGMNDEGTKQSETRTNNSFTCSSQGAFADGLCLNYFVGNGEGA